MLDPPSLRRAANLSETGEPLSSSLGSFKRKIQTLITTSKQQATPPTDDVPPPQNGVDASVSTSSASPAVGDIRVPLLLQQGTPMTKVSLKRHKKFVFRLDADLGQIVWESKQHKIIPIENIKEIRSGEDARYYRQQFQLSQDYQDRWLTIVYLLDGNYKTLHLIPATKDVFRMWYKTLRELHAIRQELMRGLGNGEMRQALWEKHYWTGADDKLTFDQVEKLCRRLNIHSNHEDLFSLFKQADKQNRGFLDFDDFRHFVKLLKARPEINRLYNKLKATNGGVFDFGVFENFMREKQQSTSDSNDLLTLFTKFSTNVNNDASFMTVESFNAFLLSPDNCAFSDQHSATWHDMTRPLSEYYISSSHNTYLVGHQLVGDSTIEGYIRALLHSCRSVEVDIYDGDQEPMVFHGKSFTSKVSLREVCEAILKYGFVASPYPIIISAEIHCSIGQQDLIAAIMMQVFGEKLVKMPIMTDGEGGTEKEEAALVEGLVMMTNGKMEVDELPSPEQLKGRILLKAKNLELLKVDSLDSEGSYTDPSSSASDSDAFNQSETTYKDQLLKARTSIVKRVRSVGKSSKLKPQSPRSQSQSPHPPLAVLPPTAVPSPTAALSSSKSPVPTSPPDFSPQSPSSATTRPRNLHHPSLSASDSDAFNQSEINYKDQLLRARTSMIKSVRSVGRSSKTAQSPRSQSQPPPPSATLSPTVSSPPAVLSSKTPIPTSPFDFSSRSPSATTATKPRMSPTLLSLLVYTVGVKFRGLNKKEEYAPCHMFSLSENVANKMTKYGMMGEMIKHTRTHLVRTYPKGTRLSSTNYEPHRFWAAGMQLVAINWQTFDLGYMINHAMFQRNGRSGYVLKPPAVRLAQKELLAKRTLHSFEVTIISAQQLPRPRDASGLEVLDKGIVDPYVEVTLYVPDWPVVHHVAVGGGAEGNERKEKGKKEEATRQQETARMTGEDETDDDQVNVDDDYYYVNDEDTTAPSPSPAPALPLLLQPPPQPPPVGGMTRSSTIPARSISSRTSVVKKNGFNPVWEEKLNIMFDCVGDMMDLVFVRFVVRQEKDKDGEEPLAVYCASMGSLQCGYRHLPLHDSQLSQYLFSTLFVKMNVTSFPSSQS